ncbi:hypothetical protein FC72_GL000513 [Companilactobacillus tucceti DSM 20183]|uniref:Uncharacterized protein n=1 Tax=Companilactobacillus tucceti DSM 20183 TaxID=1423811 RepID=A0A0R1IZD1_9LACO|nr:hypothetical protein [Companilactobacillus tucceti]KRK64344.1 hypothetical protein FC72_GL000513 [Companilactobacillus tucceti DSM 20183]
MENSAVESMQIAREVISKNLLKTSGEYKRGMEACDEAIAELQLETCEYCDPMNSKPFGIVSDDSSDINYTSVVIDENIITDRVENECMNWERFTTPINYCPMCGRKLEVEE